MLTFHMLAGAKRARSLHAPEGSLVPVLSVDPATNDETICIPGGGDFSVIIRRGENLEIHNLKSLYGPVRSVSEKEQSTLDVE